MGMNTSDSRMSKVELKGHRKRMAELENCDTLRSDDRPNTPTNLPLAGGAHQTDGVAQGQDTGLIWPAKDFNDVVITYVEKIWTCISINGVILIGE